jgi:hypothetical protein
LGKICPKIAKLIEFTLEKYICPKYSQFLFQKKIHYLHPVYFTTYHLYKVVGRYQGQEWCNKLPFKIGEGQCEVEEDKGELSSIRRSKDGVANAGPLLLFCLLATRYNALDTIKARTKEKGNAAALTKAKGKCALIERSIIGLNS